jgi:hypothetical protein
MATAIIVEPFPIIVPWPKEENRLLAPIRPFQPLVLNIHIKENQVIQYSYQCTERDRFG